jgi:Ca2+-binding EF-hand superfamily protein
VFQAYTLIEKDHGNAGVKGIDFIKLAQMLCIDYPAEILHGILRLLEKREEENVEFDEFLCGIKTILVFDNYFEEMEQLFRYLDVTKVGKIKKDDLVFAVKKINQQKSELRVPTVEDVEMVYTQIDVVEDGVLNYDEYLILLFKTALDNFGAE